MSSSPSDGEAVSYYPVPAESDLPPDLQNLFARARQALGFVPNVFRAYSYRPERLSAWFGHYRQLHVATDHLSEAEREMIAVTVSMANRCLYCLVAHGAALRQALGDPVLADRITFDYRRAGLDAKQRAVLDYAWKITRDPTECDETDIAHLRGLGLTLEEVWDVSEIAAMYNFTNRLAMATGQLPNREYHYLVRSAD